MTVLKTLAERRKANAGYLAAIVYDVASRLRDNDRNTFVRRLAIVEAVVIVVLVVCIVNLSNSQKIIPFAVGTAADGQRYPIGRIDAAKPVTSDIIARDAAHWIEMLQGVASDHDTNVSNKRKVLAQAALNSPASLRLSSTYYREAETDPLQLETSLKRIVQVKGYETAGGQVDVDYVLVTTGAAGTSVAKMRAIVDVSVNPVRDEAVLWDNPDQIYVTDYTIEREPGS